MSHGIIAIINLISVWSRRHSLASESIYKTAHSVLSVKDKGIDFLTSFFSTNFIGFMALKHYR